MHHLSHIQVTDLRGRDLSLPVANIRSVLEMLGGTYNAEIVTDFGTWQVSETVTTINTAIDALGAAFGFPALSALDSKGALKQANPNLTRRKASELIDALQRLAPAS